MKFNGKTAIVGLLILIYATLAFIGVKKNFETTDDKVLQFYRQANYGAALAYAEELHKQSHSAKYLLYQAYILRDDQEVQKSTACLKKALKGAKPAQLPEIHLNLALNALLRDDLASLQAQVAILRQLGSKADLFRGLAAFLERDYEKALPFLQKQKSIPPTSPWMKHSFEKALTQSKIDEIIVLCLIKTSQFNLAEQKLKKMENSDRLHFLKGLKAYHEKTEFQPFLKQIKNRELIADEFKQELIEMRSNLSQSLDFLQEVENLDSLASILLEEIDRKPTADLLQKVQNQNLRVKLLYMIDQRVEQLLQERNFLVLAGYIQLTENPTTFAQKIGDFGLKLLNSRNEKIEDSIACLKLWEKVEENPNEKCKMATRLTGIGSSLWQEGKYLKAVDVFKLSGDTALTESYLLASYKKALNEERIEECFAVLDAVKILKLNPLKLYDRGQVNQLLDDADYFLEKGLCEQAHKRALLVLKLEPQNQRANTLILKINKQKF